MVERSARLWDELLVLRCRAGDEAAFRGLVQRWQRPLWRHVYRLLGREDVAWDVVQETWIAVTKGLATLESPSGFRSWLFTIATRRAADHARGERPTDELDGGEAQHESEEDPARGAVELLRAALRRLSPERRALLSMRYVESFELEEIARVLGIPEGTVKSRLHHARNELRLIIERLDRTQP